MKDLTKYWIDDSAEAIERAPFKKYLADVNKYWGGICIYQKELDDSQVTEEVEDRCQQCK